jgi:hypothetical protein
MLTAVLVASPTSIGVEYAHDAVSQNRRDLKVSEAVRVARGNSKPCRKATKSTRGTFLCRSIDTELALL